MELPVLPVLVQNSSCGALANSCIFFALNPWSWVDLAKVPNHEETLKEGLYYCSYIGHTLLESQGLGRLIRSSLNWIDGITHGVLDKARLSMVKTTESYLLFSVTYSG